MKILKCSEYTFCGFSGKRERDADGKVSRIYFFIVIA